MRIRMPTTDLRPFGGLTQSSLVVMAHRPGCQSENVTRAQAPSLALHEREKTRCRHLAIREVRNVPSA